MEGRICRPASVDNGHRGVDGKYRGVRRSLKGQRGEVVVVDSRRVDR